MKWRLIVFQIFYVYQHEIEGKGELNNIKNVLKYI